MKQLATAPQKNGLILLLRAPCLPFRLPEANLVAVSSNAIHALARPQ